MSGPHTEGGAWSNLPDAPAELSDALGRLSCVEHGVRGCACMWHSRGFAAPVVVDVPDDLSTLFDSPAVEDHATPLSIVRDCLMMRGLSIVGTHAHSAKETREQTEASNEDDVRMLLEGLDTSVCVPYGAVTLQLSGVLPILSALAEKEGYPFVSALCDDIFHSNVLFYRERPAYAPSEED